MTAVPIIDLDRCPECSAEWRAANGWTSALVGIYDDRIDRTVEWLCPDCGHRWDRHATVEVEG